MTASENSNVVVLDATRPVTREQTAAVKRLADETSCTPAMAMSALRASAFNYEEASTHVRAVFYEQGFKGGGHQANPHEPGTVPYDEFNHGANDARNEL